MSKTVSPLRKFYRWKYSGLIVVPGACVLILVTWFSLTAQAEFFEYWTCDTLKNYVNGVDLPDDITIHDDLETSQHLHLHKLLNECSSFERFGEPFQHGSGSGSSSP